MHLLSILTLGIGFGIGLGADAMSVSASVGIRHNTGRHKFRLAWHMGLFQFLMPIAGYFAGAKLASVVSVWGRFISAGLIGAIGIKMLIDVLKNSDADEDKSADPTKGWSLIALCVATSLDALFAGVSLGLSSENSPGDIWIISLVIGIVAAVMSFVGVLLGKKIGTKIGKPAELAGAIVLLLLALKFAIFG